MTFEIGKYIVKLLNESDFQIGSKDNNIEYRKSFFTESDFILATKFGIQILENGLESQNAIIGAEGGASGLHETSQIIEKERILVCCGDTIFCLGIPDLNLIWKSKVDEFTCFEIFKIENGYIVHGEMEISRIDDDGQIVWKNGGADIFVSADKTDDFEISDNYIKALDWDKKVYKWDFDGNEIA
ncbi:hypothetical protein [Zobellia alginiliquefaciens]|uniref:hypothetical protein n=1 Tax=Zobellia alginiliquefaciens TaxID=3032586 RepID=UPI0023E3F2F0|nr:hypothetical protein [Zobellia alginiliquefaciens]